MKTLVLLLAVTAIVTSFNVRQNHDYWYTANRKFAQSKIPFTDAAYNYCDAKCTSFEKRVAGYDFYVIKFKDKFYKPDFAACYARPIGSVRGDDSKAKIWSDVTKNDWYETNCGGDKENYLTLPDKYTKDGYMGELADIIKY